MSASESSFPRSCGQVISCTSCGTRHVIYPPASGYASFYMILVRDVTIRRAFLIALIVIDEMSHLSLSATSDTKSFVIIWEVGCARTF
jgi:hypothetical protein